jgi:2,4-dienoyl-CoA reductase-like NADH-dependent reductase (Old Yellow Enzyme family)
VTAGLPWTALEPFTELRRPLANRIVLSAVTRARAEPDGTPTAEMAAYYRRFAENGIGLIVSEATFVDLACSRAYFDQPGIADERHLRGWRRIAEAVQPTGARMVVQLQHGGALSEPNLGFTAIGPTSRPAKGLSWQQALPYTSAREADKADLANIRRAFAQAARRAVQAGFDGVELHGARGYLLDGFLSASTNIRTDEYGGSLSRRLRFPQEVVDAVREAIGDALLIYNLSLDKMDDPAYLPPGGVAEIAAIVETLTSAGVDVLHATTRGLFEPKLDNQTFPSIVTSFASVPVIGGGGIITLEEVDRAIREGHCDLISMARCLIANPDWLQRVQGCMPLIAYSRGIERESSVRTAEHHQAGAHW